MAEVEFHLHNEVGIKFPPLRPAYSDGEVFFGRFRALVSRRTGTSSIGEGGTGRIHLVRDELMEREVALKIPLDSILRDPAAREDVIQETRQAMELTHPNIVRIHDFHEEVILENMQTGLPAAFGCHAGADDFRQAVDVICLDSCAILNVGAHGVCPRFRPKHPDLEFEVLESSSGGFDGLDQM